MTREYYMLKFFIDSDTKKVWNIEAIFMCNEKNYKNKIINSNNIIIEIDTQRSIENVEFYNTTSYDIVVPDLTLLSEEEFFQFSLVNDVYRAKNSVKKLECIREIQKKLKEEYFSITEKIKKNQNQININLLWKEITIEY